MAVALGAVVSVGATAGVCVAVTIMVGAAEVQAYAIEMKIMKNVMNLIEGFLFIPFSR